MKLKIVESFVCSFAVLCSTAVAATPSMSRAKDAVENELNREYKLDSDNELVKCHRSTTTVYKCSWEGYTRVSLVGTYSYCRNPHGTSIVDFHKDGVEVTISFSGRYNLCSYPYGT